MEQTFAVDARHHGKGAILFQWHPHSTYIASTGTSRVVHVVTRKGKLVDQIVPPSASKCTALEWNKDGTTLAVVQAGAGVVLLWDLATKKTKLFDSGARDLAFLRWARHSNSFLAAPTRGDPVLVDAFTLRRWPCRARAKGRPLSGVWSEDGRLAVSSEDGVISVCDVDGEEVDVFKLRGKATQLQFCDLGKQGAALSAVVDGTSLLLVALEAKDQAVELGFEAKYGRIRAYHWVGRATLAVAFATGFFVVLSADNLAAPQEQYCARFHEQELLDVAFSAPLRQAATCGDGLVKRIDLATWEENQVHVYEEPIEGARAGAWSPDGALLVLSTAEGCMRAFRVAPEDSAVKGFQGENLPLSAARPFTAPAFFGTVGFVLLVALVAACIVLDAPPSELLDAVTGITPVV